MARDEERSKRIREEFKKKRIEKRQGYLDPMNALRKREELLKAQAYPEAGSIWSKFKDIAAINPEAAEQLTSKEYDIRQLPYRGISGELEAAETAREKMLSAQSKLQKQLAREQNKVRTAQEREYGRGVKARAQQEIWRTDPKYVEWDEKRIRLELRKRDQLRFYTPPKKKTETKSSGGLLERLRNAAGVVSDWIG